jgi:RHS repeat-associated protein
VLSYTVLIILAIAVAAFAPVSIVHGQQAEAPTPSVSELLTKLKSSDGLDRLTSEANPQGNISYSYDAASRRSTMQIAGQSQVSYAYDNGNRLTQILQGNSTVGFSYDNDSRRSTLTLPNGIVGSYSYDEDSRLTGISYSLNSNSVGNLAYGYDALGQRISVSGSLATTGFPSAVSSANYDAANELTNWNGMAITYDADGNVLSDSVHGYTWDARNHLSMIDAGGTASLVYDPFDRRVNKTILGTTTGFLFDGVNPVQELSSGTPSANLIAWRTDEYFQRTDSIGSRAFLTDALGSTLALTDSTGTVQTQYGYDPFGGTTSYGQASTNSFQYTGRENDNIGIYYYRARYYEPQVGRFIAEDPIGFKGGKDFYAYVGNRPTRYKDPSGLRDCDQENIDCVRHCMSKPVSSLPWPVGRCGSPAARRWSRYAYCTATCLAAYMDCVAESEGKKLVEYCKANPGTCATIGVGTVVIILQPELAPAIAPAAAACGCH